MPRVSRKPVAKSVANELEDQLCFLISLLNQRKEIEEFFFDFLTNEEKTMLAKRLMLHFMLSQNYSTQDIATVLGISRETVRVHQRIKTQAGETHRSMMKKLSQRERSKELLVMITKILKPLDLALRAKTDMRARAKLASGDWNND